MAQPPLCTNPACRQPMTFLSEEHNSYVFGCYACGSARIITKSRFKDIARQQALLKRQSITDPKSSRTYFFSKGT